MTRPFRVISLVLVLALLSVLLCSCKPSYQDQMDNLFSNVDQDAVSRFSAAYDDQMGRSGDTYCSKCKKYMEGKVRICTFCGQYIN